MPLRRAQAVVDQLMADQTAKADCKRKKTPNRKVRPCIQTSACTGSPGCCRLAIEIRKDFFMKKEPSNKSAMTNSMMAG